MVGLATESEARLLFQDAVRFLVESLGAEKGLVLYGRQRLEVQASFRLKLNEIRGESLLNQVRTEGTPLLGLRNGVICVPFSEPGSRRVAGVLYAERSDPRRPFTQHHLKRLDSFVRNLATCLFHPTSRSEGSTLAFRKARAASRENLDAQRRAASSSKSSIVSLKGPLALRSLTVFFRSLSTMLGAGIGIHRAVGLLALGGEDFKMREACLQMEKQLLSGVTLSKAMQATACFSSFQVQLVRTGEKSGGLPTVLQHLADYQEKAEASLMKIKSALTYPLLVFCASLAMLILAPPFLLRGQLEMIKNSGAELPLITQGLIMVSDSLLSPYVWGSALFALLLGIPIATRVLRTPQGKYALQSFVDKLPGLGGLFRTFAVGQFARSLTIQLKAGVLWTEAVPLAAASSGHTLLENRASAAVQALRDGDTPDESLRRLDFFPETMLELLRIGQETGTPEHLMEWVADFYDSELESTVERLVALLEPLIMLGMGILVGLMLVGTLLPMVSVLNLL